MQPETWKDTFDERQRKEINFAIVYARDFAHGTTGHNALMIIAKMAGLLDVAEGIMYETAPEAARKQQPLE